MAKAKSQNQGFMYEEKNNKNNSASKATTVHPTMLPPFFREKSRFVQKIYLFVLIISISIATGITSFIMLDDFAAKYGITSGSQIAYLVMSLVMWFAVIGGSTLYAWWSRTRGHLFTITGVLSTILSPLILSGVLLYLDLKSVDALDVETTKQAFFILGASAFGSGVVTGVLIIIRNVIATKIYRDAKFRALFTFPGLVIASTSPLLLWFTAKEHNFGSFEISQFIYSFVTLFGGAVTLTLGIMFSMKYKFTETKSTTTAIKLSGSLPTIIIFTSLLAIALKFMGIFSVEMPLIIVVAADILLLGLFGSFLFFKARIKNIGHTNPLFNEFIIKGFTIIISTIGLIVTAMLPNLMTLKSYAPLSFSILAVTALSVMFVVLMSHFTNLIVFEKFHKSIVVTSAITILVILVLVFVLGTLNQSQVIIQIISRSLVLVFLLAAIIGEVFLLLLDLFAINKDVFKTARFINKKNKDKKKKKKQDEEEINIEESVAA